MLNNLVLNKFYLESAEKNRCIIENGKIIDKKITNIKSNHKKSNNNSIIVFLKEFLKKFPKLYYFIIYLISPVYYNKYILSCFIKECNNKIALNIGSGNQSLGKNVINLDLFNYENVDIISNAYELCIKDSSVDRVISLTCLEHVDLPDKLIRETYRILKQGGKCFFSVPFIYGYHSSPTDFTRWTHQGLKNIFEKEGFTIDKIDVLGGPGSAFTHVTTEFLAVLFSFGIKPLYEILTIIFMLILWPIKFTDIILSHFSFSNIIASVFYVIASKNSTLK